MALPTIPFFQCPWKTAYGHTLTFTYPTGGVSTYGVIIAAGTEFDNLFALIAEISSQLEAYPAIAGVFWIRVSIDGYVTISCSTGIAWDVAEVLSAGGQDENKFLYWMGFNPDGYANKITQVAPNRHHRGFYPQLPLQTSPGFSRTRNQAIALAQRTEGGILLVTSPVITGGGFTSVKFIVDYQEDEAAIAASTTADQVLYAAHRWLSGARDIATSQLSYGGTYDLGEWGPKAGDFDLDALPTGGAAENRFSYFAEWFDFSDYATMALYLAAQSFVEYSLHPDLSEVTFVPRFAGDSRYWRFEFVAFEAP